MEVIHVMMLALFFKSIMQYGGFFSIFIPDNISLQFSG